MQRQQTRPPNSPDDWFGSAKTRRKTREPAPQTQLKTDFSQKKFCSAWVRTSPRSGSLQILCNPTNSPSQTRRCAPILRSYCVSPPNLSLLAREDGFANASRRPRRVPGIGKVLRACLSFLDATFYDFALSGCGPRWKPAKKEHVQT
jgi:hypothetical protein